MGWMTCWDLTSKQMYLDDLSSGSQLMNSLPQLRIPATYMRGGTSKGVFFRLQDLPFAAQIHGPARDALLMRVIGSPDPYGKTPMAWAGRPPAPASA